MNTSQWPGLSAIDLTDGMLTECWVYLERCLLGISSQMALNLFITLIRFSESFENDRINLQIQQNVFKWEIL